MPWIAADLSPPLTLAVTSTMSRSIPDMLCGAPVSCGRSPATDTTAPRFERVLLKKLFAGFCPLPSAAPPLKKNWSPRIALSPSKAMIPSFAV